MWLRLSVVHDTTFSHMDWTFRVQPKPTENLRMHDRSQTLQSSLQDLGEKLMQLQMEINGMTLHKLNETMSNLNSEFNFFFVCVQKTRRQI